MKGISERAHRDRDDSSRQPSSHSGSDPRLPRRALSGRAAAIADNSCATGDGIESAWPAVRDARGCHEESGEAYDTLTGPPDSTGIYNSPIASLCVRAVNALEGIAVALQRMAAGQPTQSESVPAFDRVYGTGEAAALLDLNEQTVRKYCRERVFGTQMERGRWVIRQSEVDHYLRGRARISGKK